MKNITPSIPKKKIILLCGPGDLTNIVYNELRKNFSIEKVILEKSISKSALLKRRIKKLGMMTVFGQIIFQAIIVKFLKKQAAVRIEEIKKEYQLNTDEIPQTDRLNVNSVNADETLKTLSKLNPDVVVVSGTRKIDKHILDACQSTFINVHAGITPLYRGVHGAYWALVENNKKNCGVTVHLVDSGLDTGQIIYQDTIEVTHKDNFATYPYLQLIKGLPLLTKAIEDVLGNRVIPISRPELSSKLRYHPTALTYFINRWFKYKVK